MSFYVGQKVVCVDASVERGRHLTPLLEGAVYTITAIKPSPVPTHRRHRDCNTSLYLEEADNAYAGYAQIRFRPVAEKPASMDIIRSIVLDPHRDIPDDPREPKHVKTPEEVASIPGGVL